MNASKILGGKSTSANTATKAVKAEEFDKSHQVSLKYWDDTLGEFQPAGTIQLLEGSDKAAIIDRMVEEDWWLVPPVTSSFTLQDFFDSSRPFDLFVGEDDTSVGVFWPIKVNKSGFKPISREEAYALKKAGLLEIAAGSGARKLTAESKAVRV